MKNLVYLSIVLMIFVSACGTSKKAVTVSDDQKEAPVVIANDSLEYEIIIIDPGFNTYLNTIAKPMTYYSQDFLESHNRIYVNEWNNRARNPMRYKAGIYENVIDYNPATDYGLEVNYKLFWYFQFAQRKYNMRLSGFRIYD